MSAYQPISVLAKGTAFVRAAAAMTIAAKMQVSPETVAENRWRDSPGTLAYLRQKAAIGAGSTTDSSFASALAFPSLAPAEFAELQRKGSLTGRLGGMRHVPFNVKFPRQLSASTVGWVGEGAAAAQSKMTFELDTMGYAKVAAIVAISQELLLVGRPDAEALIKNDLVKGSIEFLDQQFIDPGVAAVANVSPASVTFGITPTQSSGSTAALIRADLATLATGMADANETDALAWIMTRSDAVRLAAKATTTGGAAFEEITATGGTLLGIPVIVSNAVPHATSPGSIVVLVNQSGINYADSGYLDLSVSTEAALQMDSAPNQSSTTPTASTTVSMFQTNSVAIRITSFRNWSRVRDTAVAYIDNCHW